MSADGRRIAFIANCDGNFKVFVTEEQLDKNDEDVYKKALLLQRLVCIRRRTNAQEVFPRNIFLVKSPDVSQDILFITCMNGQIIYCSDFSSRQMESAVESLERFHRVFKAPCLSLSQTLGRNVLLLDTVQVHVFDFKRSTWRNIPYRSNFATTISQFDPDE